MLLSRLRSLLVALTASPGAGRWAQLQRLVGGLVALPALGSRTELLLELALLCCQPIAPRDSIAGPATASKPEMRKLIEWEWTRGGEGGCGALPPSLIGSYLLLQLFRSCEAQPHILGATFDALAQEDLDGAHRDMCDFPQPRCHRLHRRPTE